MEDNRNESVQENKVGVDVLRRKSTIYFSLSIGAVLFFAMIYFVFLFWQKDSQTAIIMSGAFVSLYFAYQGYDLSNISKKGNYDVERFICTNIGKSGYRRQNRRIVFLQSERKEPFIFNTNKNLDFIEGMEYDIYFRKDHRTSLNVLTISLSNTQTQYTPNKEKDKKK